MRRILTQLCPILCFALMGGCGSETTNDESLYAGYYGVTVEAFEPGTDAGYGQNRLPGVVLGPPLGRGTAAGSVDVLSLGLGGSIVLGFGETEIVNGDGPDFIIFENAFWAGNDASQVWADPAEVSVSDDGVTWTAFPCTPDLKDLSTLEGCAGWQPVLSYDVSETVPLDPELTGGDAFDLEEIGLERIRYIKIRDLSVSGATPTAGFDLDAVGIIHPDPIPSSH